MQGPHQQRVRPQGGRETDRAGGVRRDGVRDVALDVVPAAQQQRHQHGGRAAEGAEGVRQQRLVQLDVPEPDVEAGPRRAHQAGQGPRGGQGPGVAAAVRHEHEGGA